MINDREWLKSLLPGFWLGSNGEQKPIDKQHPDYRLNCFKKLDRIKKMLETADDPNDKEYIEIVEDKIEELKDYL